MKTREPGKEEPARCVWTSEWVQHTGQSTHLYSLQIVQREVPGESFNHQNSSVLVAVAKKEGGNLSCWSEVHKRWGPPFCKKRWISWLPSLSSLLMPAEAGGFVFNCGSCWALVAMIEAKVGVGFSIWLLEIREELGVDSFPFVVGFTSPSPSPSVLSSCPDSFIWQQIPFKSQSTSKQLARQQQMRRCS